MKKVLLAQCALMSSIVGFCQNKEGPSIVSAGGGISKFSGINLEWTIGEPFVGSVKSGNGFHTIGFHQPMLKIIDGSSGPSLSGIRMNIFPNPVSNILKVDLWLDKPKNVHIVLSDLLGHQLIEKEVDGKFSSTELNVGSIAAGVYYLRIIDSNGIPMKVFKVLKAN